jgi:hypothetical protein
LLLFPLLYTVFEDVLAIIDFTRTSLSLGDDLSEEPTARRPSSWRQKNGKPKFA